MVFFVCEDCNETLKRLKVAQHLCRCSCSAITCVDCGATFHDDSYLQHATCMSEAERYEGNLYKAPKKKNAQDAWAELVQAACADRADAPPFVAPTPGARDALVVKFQLPSSAYATVCLRELTGQSFSTAAHISAMNGARDAEEPGA